MNNNDYKEALFYAASIFNERLGAEFSEDNLVLCCFQTENQQEVFEQFCKQYFPDRLEDRYTEDGYFDFHGAIFSLSSDYFSAPWALPSPKRGNSACRPSPLWQMS